MCVIVSPFASSCHSERSEESHNAQDRLRRGNPTHVVRPFRVVPPTLHEAEASQYAMLVEPTGVLTPNDKQGLPLFALYYLSKSLLVLKYTHHEDKNVVDV